MKNWIIGLMLMGSTFAFQSCSDDDENNPMDRQMFVTQATSGNLLEIQAGQAATQKGQNQAVKDYGQEMVTDHTAASVELAAIAVSKNLTVSTQLTTAHQQQLAVLSPLTGTDFDKAFASLMVQSHQEQINLFDDAAKNLDDPELKNFAAEKLPILQQHLQAAQQLDNTVNP